MELIINNGKPSSELIWNELALANSNLLCSTFYDKTQDYYKLNPIYFEFIIENRLVAGVKLYSWSNSKLPFISKQIMQFGEYIILDECKCKTDLTDEINARVKEYLLKGGFITFAVSSYYGNSDLLLCPFSVSKFNKYAVSYVDVTDDDEVIYSRYKDSHKGALKRAIREELIFEKLDNVEVLVELVEETFLNQDKSGPSPNYIRSLYNELAKYDVPLLFAVRDNDRYLCAAMILKFGNVADYAFGGTRRNEKGAGQLLHHSIIKYLKDINIHSYSLGQTADYIDVNNLKFTDGITKFKRGFGTINYNAFNYEYIIKRGRFFIYNLILKVYKLWK